MLRLDLTSEPRWLDLDGIVETSARWMRDHPAGYGPRA